MEAEAEGLRHFGRSWHAVVLDWTRQGRFENIEFLIRQVVEDAFRPAKVFYEYLTRGVAQPVGEQESAVLTEVAVVEYEEEFGAVRFEALDAMGNAGWEEPEIALANVIDEGAAVLIYSGDARPAFDHVGPFGGGVPMQLPHAAGGEPHVHPGHGAGHGELASGRLARPAAGFDALVGKGEGPFDIGKFAVVGAGRSEQVAVLKREGDVVRAQDRGAEASAFFDWLRRVFADLVHGSSNEILGYPFVGAVDSG